MARLNTASQIWNMQCWHYCIYTLWDLGMMHNFNTDTCRRLMFIPGLLMIGGTMVVEDATTF